MKLVVHQILPSFFPSEIFVLFFVLCLMRDYKSQRSGFFYLSGCLTHIFTSLLEKKQNFNSNIPRVIHKPQVRSEEGKMYANHTPTPSKILSFSNGYLPPTQVPVNSDGQCLGKWEELTHFINHYIG